LGTSAPRRYRAFATDFDGTLAHEGVVRPEAMDALQRLKAAGLVLLMVTGREIEDLSRVFPPMDLFDLIVAENGALLYWPGSKHSQRLTEAPPQKFVETLQARGVSPLSVGHSIVATCEPHHQTVLECIHDLGLELHVIFNKGAVMILPTGVNKASGLQAALEHLHIDRAAVVGIGDAENDHAFLDFCGWPVAVQNALPALKERALTVTRGEDGQGIAEIAEMLLAGIEPTR
jgi:HAD superfamily hydrolase (TIGR01484 family)